MHILFKFKNYTNLILGKTWEIRHFD
jgi:hypothetical protein